MKLRILRWFEGFDRCRFGHWMGTRSGYTLCRKHEGEEGEED